MQTLINKLKAIRKPFFTFADVQKVSDLDSASLKVTLSRAAKAGVIQRLKRGLYRVPNQAVNPFTHASLLYTPSYISFETALAEYGILSQIPYTVTSATTKRSKRFQIEGMELEYRQLNKKFFFSWVKRGNYLIATPEKSLLDTLYLIARGKLGLRTEQFDLRNVDRKKLVLLSQAFPENVRLLVKNLEVKRTSA